jgi:hypothetical protein
LRGVEAASRAIAIRHQRKDFLIPPSRLSDIETKGIVPSAFRMYSLAVIYRCSLGSILSWYGIDVDGMAKDTSLVYPSKPHQKDRLQTTANVQIPACRIRYTASLAETHGRNT